MKLFPCHAVALFFSFVAALPGAEDPQLKEATDFNGPWTQGAFDSMGSPAAGTWTDAADRTADGVDAVVGKLAGFSVVESWADTTVTGPAVLYFSYRVTNFTGSYAGAFSVLVGETERSLSASTGHANVDTGWKEDSVAVPAGTHHVRWKLAYFRGASPVSAYLDQVWTDGDPRPRLTSLPLQNGALGAAYSWTVPVSSTTTGLSASGLPPGLTVNPATFEISGTPSTPGTYQVALTASNTVGRHVGNMVFEIAPGSTGLADALDAPSLSFSQPGGATVWQGVTGLGQDGVDCARASLVTTPGGAGHRLNTTLNGPGTLSFWYRNDERSTPGDRSIISLYVGSSSSPSQPLQQLEATAWTRVSVPVPAGPQTVAWEAWRLVGTGPTAPVFYAYLDGVQFTPSTIPPQPTFAAWTSAWGVADQSLTSDLDGDGLALLMEYATGGSPFQPNPELLPTVSIVDGYFTLNFIKASSPTDLIYFAQGTRDLIPNSWSSSTVDVVDEDGSHILARCKKPVVGEPIFHMRIRVLLAP